MPGIETGDLPPAKSREDDQPWKFGPHRRRLNQPQVTLNRPGLLARESRDSRQRKCVTCLARFAQFSHILRPLHPPPSSAMTSPSPPQDVFLSGFVNDDFVQLPEYKAAGVSEVDFDGLLKTPLRLHEDLKEGCGGQLWPAGMVLSKHLLRQKQVSGSMYVVLKSVPT